LDLAEVPVTGVRDSAEILTGTMEGKTCVPDAAVLLGLIKEISHTQLFDTVPERANKCMDKIIVDVICFEFSSWIFRNVSISSRFWIRQERSLIASFTFWRYPSERARTTNGSLCPI
jgi:hypothetical protein